MFKIIEYLEVREAVELVIARHHEKHDAPDHTDCHEKSAPRKDANDGGHEAKQRKADHVEFKCVYDFR